MICPRGVRRTLASLPMRPPVNPAGKLLLVICKAVLGRKDPRESKADVFSTSYLAPLGKSV